MALIFLTIAYGIYCAKQVEVVAEKGDKAEVLSAWCLRLVVGLTFHVWGVLFSFNFCLAWCVCLTISKVRPEWNNISFFDLPAGICLSYNHHIYHH